jgi:hypothetical protein
VKYFSEKPSAADHVGFVGKTGAHDGLPDKRIQSVISNQKESIMSRFCSSYLTTAKTPLFAIVTVLGVGLSLGAGVGHAAPSVGKTNSAPMNYVAGGGFLA